MAQGADPAPLQLRTSEAPRVSIVMCVYGQPAMTLAALRSIAAAADEVDYELIVVDDASPDDTAAVVAGVEGLRLLVNERNRGYLLSTNAGMLAARGEYVLLLNNDVEVAPGWLSSLVARADSDPRIGAVGSKLLSLDGTVQEAGAIVWADATGWNYGRGWAALDPRVGFARDVDYCSAASLLVRRSALQEAGGGYDERYAPAYYEDTDLCFSLWAKGYRVVYEPRSVVVHAEGASHGTDLSTGPKSGQVRNREVFARTWADTLSRQPVAGAEQVESARDHRPRRLLVVDARLPDVTNDSGSVRLSAVIEALIAEGWVVHLWNTDGRQPEAALAALTALGVRVFDPARPADGQIRQLGPELVACWVSRPSVANTVMLQLARLVPAARLIYDTVDLHFLRDQRQLEVSVEHFDERALKISKELELAAVRAADVTVAISDDEGALLSAEVPGATVVTLGNIHPVVPRAAGPRGRRGLLFVGGWEHLPNVEAARVLATEVMPLLRARAPGVRLSLVGSRVTDEVRSFAAADIDVLGWLPDLTPVLDRARVFCAPLTWGAGVKGKIGQALAHGLPVVTTPIGAEGMGLVDGSQVLIAPDIEGIVAATVRLLTDDDLWERLSVAGQERIAAAFGPSVAARRLRDITSLVSA